MGLRDSIAKFQAAQTQPQPKTVLPPEAAQVLLEQTLPEVERPLAPLPETPTTNASERVKRHRRTKAEMEAARAVTSAPAEPASPGPTSAATPSPSATVAFQTLTDPGIGVFSPEGMPSPLFLVGVTDKELVAELFTRGYSVSKL